MTAYGRILEETYTRLVDDHNREVERLRAAREQKAARTRQTYAELQRVLKESEPFLSAQGFFLLKDEDAEVATLPERLAASIGDTASRQLVAVIAVDENTFIVTQPLLVGDEPYTTNDLKDVIVRVAQILAAYRYSSIQAAPTARL
jgi:hypothetical protein